MRKFFANIIANLYIYCGNRQAEKMTDDELKTLLDALERVCKLYSYIPEPEQKAIIEKCLIEDKEYQNINARVVSKWLELNGKKFFQEEAHKETKEYEPASDEQKAFWLEEWKKQLNAITSNFEVRPISHAEIMRERLHGTQQPTKYVIDKDKTIKANIHHDYIRANYDPITGNALETWMPEDEWTKKNYGETL